MNIMCNTKLVVVLAFYMFVALNPPNSNWQVYGQMNGINDSAISDTDLVFAAISNMSAGTAYNNTRIMENTSGMIDDAFDAIKDTFKSLFGK